MALIANIKSHGGAALFHHELAKIEGDLNAAFMLVIVHSWPSFDDCTALGRNGATAVWPVPVPVENILAEAGTLAQRCEAALIAFDDDANPFKGAAAAPSVTDLETARAVRWANLKQTRTLLDEAPIEIEPGIALDGNEASRNDILGAVVAMQIRGTTTKRWRCADNVMRDLSLEQIVAAGLGIEARRQALIEISDGLYQQLQAAVDAAAVAAITWPTGETP